MSVYTKSIEFDTFDTAHDFRSHALSPWSLHSSCHQQRGCKIRNKLLVNWCCWFSQISIARTKFLSIIGIYDLLVCIVVFGKMDHDMPTSSRMSQYQYSYQRQRLKSVSHSLLHSFEKAVSPILAWKTFTYKNAHVHIFLIQLNYAAFTSSLTGFSV